MPRDAPQSCLNEVDYFDLTTPFGQGVQRMVQYPGQQVLWFDFTRNSDGRCWLTLLQY